MPHKVISTKTMTTTIKPTMMTKMVVMIVNQELLVSCGLSTGDDENDSDDDDDDDDDDGDGDDDDDDEDDGNHVNDNGQSVQHKQ